MNATWKRELRVAFSRRAQPIWFRMLKWTVALGISARLWRTPYFWRWIIGAPLIGLTMHLVWRRKTHGWTRPWGGWNDLAAGRTM